MAFLAEPRTCPGKRATPRWRADRPFDRAQGLWEAYQFRGLARVSKGEADPAIGDFSMAIRLNPKAVLALIGRGNAYYLETRHRMALADFDAALKIEPDSFEARTRRGDTYRQLGQKAKANADYAALGKLKPGGPGD